MYLHVYKCAEETTTALAEWITVLISKTLETKENFTIALSGGETPKKLYQKLASDNFKKRIDWKKIEMFWGDERVVSFDDKNNNAKMAFDNLLDHINIPSAQIHSIRTDISAEKSAKEYEKNLHTFFDEKQQTFDLVLLGLGDDGHTLSLFPGDDVLKDKTSWVKAVNSKEKGERITLMPVVVNKASAIVFLVTGENKAKVINEILKGEQQKYPAELIMPSNGQLHWFLDEAAAIYLKP